MRATYSVSIKSKYSDNWHSPIGLLHTSLQFAKGACVGIHMFYPSPETQIVRDDNGEVIEEYPGHGEVKV